MVPHGSESHPRHATVLVVDDDLTVREDLQGVLKFAGYTVLQAGDGKTALDVLAQQPVDLVLLDLNLPRVPGMDVLRHVMEHLPEVPVVIVSGKGTIRSAVEATKLGAYDFLEKPVDMQRTLLTVRNALEKATLERQRDRLLEEARVRYRMVGTSPAMQQIYALIDKAAGSDSKVLIVGESGTGKEMIARAIHHNSARAGGPFVAVNCAAIPESLIESELFGHEKGAYTGAGRMHQGKFEQAHQGTLFLDEVGDMSLMTQAKTLRVLEEGRIERLGGERSVPVDVRVVAATNKDLEAAMAEGNFREDLFYRLNVITIHVPPLRERREDVPHLIAHFLERFSEKETPPPRLDAGALALLVQHDWPGNIRELRNVVERLVVLRERDTLGGREVRRALQRRTQPEPSTHQADLREAREQFERDYIRAMLIANAWKIQETAEVLGIDRSHLWKKMKRYGIEQSV